MIISAVPDIVAFPNGVGKETEDDIVEFAKAFRRDSDVGIVELLNEADGAADVETVELTSDAGGFEDEVAFQRPRVVASMFLAVRLAFYLREQSGFMRRSARW